MGRIQLRNEKNTGKSFLQYFEFQDVANNVQPKTILDQNAKLVLIFTGRALRIDIQLPVEPCRRICIIRSAPQLCPAPMSTWRALPTLLHQRFCHEWLWRILERTRLRWRSRPFHTRSRHRWNHSTACRTVCKDGHFGIDRQLAAIAGSLRFGVLYEFVFKDDMKSVNYIANLERRSVPWQPSPIPPEFQKLILIDLVRKRQYIFLLVTLLIIIDLIIC